MIREAALAALLVAAQPALAAKKLGPSERIDLNRASAAELMRLPGIGKKRAQAILAHRARRPFRRLDDLLAVRGISARWLDRVRGHLVVTDPGRAGAATRADAADDDAR